MTVQHGNSSKWADPGILEWAFRSFDVKTMVDMGCGTGWSYEIAKSDNVLWTGYDMDNAAKDVPGFILHDFNTGPHKEDWVYDLFYTNQVYEHMSPECVRNTIPVLKNSKVVLFCSANAAQAVDGVGHINCHDPIYWRRFFATIGFTYSQQLTDTSKQRSTMAVKGKYGKSFWQMSGLVFINDLYNN